MISYPVMIFMLNLEDDVRTVIIFMLNLEDDVRTASRFCVAGILLQYEVFRRHIVNSPSQ